MECHSFPIDQYTIRGELNPEPQTGRMAASEEIGTGVTFDWMKLAPHCCPDGGALVKAPAAAQANIPSL